MTTFTVYGQPQGKGRPRFTTQGGFPRAYTPEKTKAYENEIRDAYIASEGQKHIGAVGMDIVAFFKIPKATSQKKRRMMLEDDILPTVKPDLDNIIKAVLDGLNGVAYNDDNQITSLTIEKRYGLIPRVTVAITALEEENAND